MALIVIRRKYCGRVKRLLSTSLITGLFVLCTYSTFNAVRYPTKEIPRTFGDGISKAERPFETARKEETVVLLGKPRTEQAFLSIGIPTVCRDNGRSYLQGTVESIINSTDEVDLHQLTIIIAVSEMNSTCQHLVQRIVYQHFKEYVIMGVIELIKVPKSFYPPLDNLPRTFGDEDYRVKWRSKQNVDFSFLMNYSQHKSKFYLQIEDDVSTKSNFLQVIRTFIAEKANASWAVLEFSSLGFIGKLFRSEELHKMSNLLLSFYSEQPCDYLLQHFMALMLQKERFLKIPTLFEHRGLHSSLTNLIRNVSDRFYDIGRKKYRGDNPPAKLYTTLRIYRDHAPEKAYNLEENGFLWSVAPQIGQTLTLVFKTPQCLKRIVINSGFKDTGHDRIEGGMVEVGGKVLDMKNQEVLCIGLNSLGETNKGQFDRDNINQKRCENGDELTSCVKLTFTKEHKHWVLINEIAIFTIKQT